MKTTKLQLLRNPDIQPTSDVIAELLQDVNEVYVKFIDKLVDHDIQLEWNYYNDGKSWLAKGLYQWTGARGGQNKKTVFWLSIWDGFFKVSIFIPENVRAEVLNLPLDNELKQTISDSKQMGKLKFFPIVLDLNSDEIFDALFILIDFKKSIK